MAGDALHQQGGENGRKEQWPHLVKQEAFEKYTDKMLSGLLELKMVADSKKNPAQAIREYQGSMSAMPKAVHKLTIPKVLVI